MSPCNCMLSGREIATNTSTNVCMTIMQNGTYFTRKLCRWRTPSRYVGVLFAYFDYLLESFGFKTRQFFKITSSKPAVFSLFVVFLLVCFVYIFFSGDSTGLIRLMELATTLKC